jgi:hypothetical protein
MFASSFSLRYAYVFAKLRKQCAEAGLGTSVANLMRNCGLEMFRGDDFSIFVFTAFRLRKYDSIPT